GTGMVYELDGDTVVIITTYRALSGRGTAPAAADISVVFHSGRPGEQKLSTTVLARDAAQDLAVLQVKGVKSPPRPIERSEKLELTGRTHAFALSFPVSKENPGLTLGRRSLSTLRMNENGEPATVQVNGD